MFALTALMIVALPAVWSTCAAGAVSARDSKFQPNMEATVKFLQKAQQEEGGFAEPGLQAEPDFSAWVTLALAAAGINPRDQTTPRQHYWAGHSAFSYLAENAHKASLTTDFERELLVVDAAGTSPYDFGGVNLVNEILQRQIGDGPEAGGFLHTAGAESAGVNDTVFAILALSPIHEPAVEETIARAAVWLEAQQGCDGSWPSVTPRPQTAGECGSSRGLLPGEHAGEVDMTGAVIEALSAAKRMDSKEQSWAFEFLAEAQINGGFAEYTEEPEPNVASTAWVVQAMWAAGINPEEWATKSGLESKEPLGYLASMQQEDGHIRYEQNLELNGMWMTAYVTPAFAGDPLPIPAPAYEGLPVSPPEEHGVGDGVGGSSGSGVSAGGGGDGAKLFSRPQPKSKGHTPGGADLSRSQKGARRHPTPKRNPGLARKQAAPTIAAANEGKAHDASKPGAARKPAGTRPGSRGSGNGGVPLAGAEATTPAAATTGTEVKGVLIGDPQAAKVDHQLEAGAPGLRSESADDDPGRRTTIAICAAIALLILAGALIERRRPQTIL